MNHIQHVAGKLSGPLQLLMVLFLFCAPSSADETEEIELRIPIIRLIERPEPVLRDDISEDIYGFITFELTITKEGTITDVKVLYHYNIPEEKLSEYVSYFKKVFDRITAEPGKENEKPVPCILEYKAKWLVAKPEEYSKSKDEIQDYSIRDPDFMKDLYERSVSKPVCSKYSSTMTLPDGRTVLIDRFRSDLHASAVQLLEANEPNIVKKRTVTFLSNIYDSKCMDYLIASVVATQGTFFNVFKNLLPEKVTLHPLRAYIYLDHPAYKRFQDTFNRVPCVHGHNFGNLYLISGYVGNRTLLRVRTTLIHETIHYMLSETIFRDWQPPLWLNEGIALYFESSRVSDKGEMILGKIDKNEYAPLDAGGKHFYSTGMNNVLFLLENKELLRGHVVENLVTERIQVDNDCDEDMVRLFNASSFVLVNYLLGSKKKDLNSSFFHYIEELRTGGDPIESFIRNFGECETLEKKFWKHVRKLK